LEATRGQVSESRISSSSFKPQTEQNSFDNMWVKVSGLPIQEGLTMTYFSEYVPFSLSIGARKNSATKYAARVWDFDPVTRLLSQRPTQSSETARELRVHSFKQLIIGEDVRGTTADGEDLWLGQLQAFTLNEPGVTIPRSFAP
jgi:hypothetical protein